MSSSRDPLVWLTLGRDAIALGIAAATGVILWLRKRSARYWPATHGRVEHASSFKESGVWSTDISYSYRVAEDFYSGQFQVKARGERTANDEVARWKDRTIEIRYSPRKPELSVVRIEDQAGLVPGEFVGH
jgi:hypothetical protein